MLRKLSPELYRELENHHVADSRTFFFAKTILTINSTSHRPRNFNLSRSPWLSFADKQLKWSKKRGEEKRYRALCETSNTCPVLFIPRPREANPPPIDYTPALISLLLSVIHDENLIRTLLYFKGVLQFI